MKVSASACKTPSPCPPSAENAVVELTTAGGVKIVAIVTIDSTRTQGSPLAKRLSLLRKTRGDGASG